MEADDKLDPTSSSRDGIRPESGLKIRVEFEIWRLRKFSVGGMLALRFSSDFKLHSSLSSFALKSEKDNADSKLSEISV